MSDALQPSDLDAIKAYTNPATGPRLLVGHKSWAGENAVLTEEGHPVAVFGHGDVAETDSVFFARARADVPKLVAEIERLREDLRKIHWEHDCSDGSCLTCWGAGPVCDRCGTSWPCETERALVGGGS